MANFLTSAFDFSTDDHVRGYQVHRMEQSLVEVLCGLFLGVGLTCALFWQEWSFALAPWTAGVFVVCGTRLVLAYRAARKPPQPCSRRTLWNKTIPDVAMSFVMTAGPIWILFHSGGATALYMTIFAVSVLWGGALVCISVFPVVFTFIAVQTLFWLGIYISSGPDIRYAGVVVLLCVSGTVALVVSRRLSTWLGNGLRERLRLESQSAEQQRHGETIRLLLKEHEDESSDWLWHTDASWKVYAVSERFADVFATSEVGLEGLPIMTILAAEVQGNAEACAALQGYMEARRPFRDLIVPGAVNGDQRWWSVSGRPTFDPDGRLAGYRGVMSDVTKEQQANARIFHLAHYDPLTDLPNRAYFLNRLETRLRDIGDGQCAVIYLDLDGFKLVNDRHGHAVGDALLVAVADRLREATTNHELVARLGGDEFVIKTRITEQAKLEVLCKELLKNLNLPFTIDTVDVRVSASLGIAFAPIDATTADVLLRNADAALYRAKQGGRGTYRFFAKALDKEMQDRADLLQDLREALPRDEFVLHYQPYVNSETSVVTGYEALIRWQHPHRGLVPPLDFIPLAEESGMIVPIGAWVIRSACAEAANWAGDSRVSVNISPVQFLDRELPECILAALVETGLPANRLEIELTESIFVSDINQALGMLRRIKALGVRVALDDFGTGYSSLSYLRSFPFDKIKIDRSFVHDLGSRPDSQVIVRAVGEIARGLKMTVTAEGVDTTEQALLLQQAGCHELQGYLYGRPERVGHEAFAQSRLPSSC